ncbi:unnamed protein product [Rangifer tarandus platyrhynchus]|uniref:Uncharacterized protein n=2 Tax=Rangifer tarandus platyrhynchus TaxID=3082113 RepID=A0ABN8Y6H5_RANTA|nr:unnamed protein product [Rangifer tarandus platyrhynchus]CAI9695557.1 unnamed protein product [Rangifer tarandus platyrhynchus]
MVGTAVASGEVLAEASRALPCLSLLLLAPGTARHGSRLSPGPSPLDTRWRCTPAPSSWLTGPRRNRADSALFLHTVLQKCERTPVDTFQAPPSAQDPDLLSYNPGASDVRVSLGPRSPAAGAESRCVKSERVPLTGCAASAERLHLSVPQSRISEMQTKVAAETGLYAR